MDIATCDKTVYDQMIHEFFQEYIKNPKTVLDKEHWLFRFQRVADGTARKHGFDYYHDSDREMELEFAKQLSEYKKMYRKREQALEEKRQQAREQLQEEEEQRFQTYVEKTMGANSGSGDDGSGDDDDGVVLVKKSKKGKHGRGDTFRLSTILPESRSALIKDCFLQAKRMMEQSGSKDLEVYRDTFLKRCRERWPSPKQDGKNFGPLPVEVPDDIVTEIIVDTSIVKIIDTDAGDKGIVAIYDEASGLYVVDDWIFAERIQILKYGTNDKRPIGKVIDEIKKKLIDRRDIEVVKLSGSDKKMWHLAAVNNGIYDSENKVLLPFSPDYVFLAKCPIDFVKDAPSPVFTDENGKSWDFDSWLRDLMSGVEEDYLLIRQVLYAAFHPYLPVNQMIVLYSGQGNSGKGSLVHVIEQLFKGNYMSCSLTQLAKDKYAASELLSGKNIIIGHENRVDEYLDNSEDIKAIISNDPFHLQIKYRMSVSFRFPGLMIQCFNSLPKLADKTESNYRRIHMVEFKKHFIGGVDEDVRIKNEYLENKAVLEYIVSNILQNVELFDKFMHTANTRKMKRELTEDNPIATFFEDCVLSEAGPWFTDIPLPVMYKVYQGWFKDAKPSGYMLGDKEFYAKVKTYLQTDECPVVCTITNTPRKVGKKLMRIINLDEAETDYAFRHNCEWPVTIGGRKTSILQSNMIMALHPWGAAKMYGLEFDWRGDKNLPSVLKFSPDTSYRNWIHIEGLKESDIHA